MSRAWPLIIMWVALAAQAAAQRVMDQRLEAAPLMAPEVPSVPVALATGLLRRPLAADIQWLRALSHAGDGRFQVHPVLPELMHLVVTLDPGFLEAYRVGGLLLSVEQGTLRAAVELLQAGEERSPRDWLLPFYRGADLFFGLGESEQAAEAWMRASALPGAPPFLSSLAERIMAAPGNCRNSLGVLEGLMVRAPVDSRRSLRERWLHISWECDMQDMEAAMARFQQREGRAPSSLDELVAQGLLPAVPPHPFGGTFSIRDGHVLSRPAMDRLHFKKPMAHPQGEKP